MTHVTWSRETGEDTCPDCGAESVLIVPSREWDVAYTPETVSVCEEVSAHYCVRCRKITSLSLNASENSL
jgi:hypothetical protein